MTSLSRDGMDKTITTGILQLCFAMLLVPVLDVFAKLLGRTLDPIQVTFMRFVMQILLLTPFVIWGRIWAIPKGTFHLQFARGILLAIATACFFAALQHLPLAEAITIYFVQPILLTAMSALFLGETIRLRRVLAIFFWVDWGVDNPATKLGDVWLARCFATDHSSVNGRVCRPDAPSGRSGSSLSNANDGWFFRHNYAWPRIAYRAGF